MMKIQFDANSYEMPWRPNYEMQAAQCWGGAAIIAGVVQHMTQMPPEPFYWMAGICGVMSLGRLPKAIRLAIMQKHLAGRALEFIKFTELKKITETKTDQMWLGYGFDWENRHAQRVFEILKRDWSEIYKEKKAKKGEQNALGKPWIHGVETTETKLFVPLKHIEGHILILGTTGSGKTRAFDLLISQAISRGESVIIIDPKGDKEMRDNARRACEKLGQPERFVMFHPAFPSESARINPLENFTRVTEIASRIAALMPTESGSDPFKAFGWQALNNVSQALVMIDEKPDLIKLRRYLEGGAHGLVVRAIESYVSKVLPDWEKRCKKYMKARGVAKDGEQDHIDLNDLPLEFKAKGLSKFYYNEIQQIKPSTDLEGLLSMHEHDASHFGKMVASLLPILSMLTSGEIGELLSPNRTNVEDKRIITDMASIINNAQVAYIGLDSLTDGMVASAIGSILLADLAAVAGDRYNFGERNRAVNVFVDEAAEVINDPFIQVLNKGRGALIRLLVATQTFSDFVTRLGSKDKAYQVLGNINNKICLRVMDPETQKFVTENLPKTRLKTVMRGQGQTTQGDEPIMHGGNQSERLVEEEADLFPAPLLGMLPNLEFLATVSGGRVIKGRLPILSEQ